MIATLSAEAFHGHARGPARTALRRNPGSFGIGIQGKPGLLNVIVPPKAGIHGGGSDDAAHPRRRC